MRPNKVIAFPAFMTILSFVLFIGVYLLLSIFTIEPDYLMNLILAVPFVIFGAITFFTARMKLSYKASSVMTCILIFVLGFLSFVSQSGLEN
jgi:hypothetical protein